ncbi:MAG: hypothetical protein K0V04_41820 [Deltaproteobacteria bacterium]|nr:hypothetical protein [Deltaproteobacteria bacterium]
MTESNQDDARANETAQPGFSGPMNPFGGGPGVRAALLDAVRAHFDGLSVWITDTPPRAGDFSMVVLGDNVQGPGLEAAPQDCGDSNPNSVVFVGIWAGDGLSIDFHAVVIAHGIGHSVGLDHVDATNAIMSGNLAGDPRLAVFVDECVSVPMVGCVSPPGPCAINEQSSWAELLDLYGPI